MLTRLVALLALLVVATGCWVDPASMAHCREMCRPRPVQSLGSTGCVCGVARPDGGR